MIIDLNNLVVRRGAFVLDIPRLQIEPGTLVGLVGANGAGKSTLLDVCAGLITADQGTVRTLGMDPRAQETVETLRRRTAWMTDDMPLFDLTLAEHIRVLGRFYPTWNAAFTQTLLRRFKLDPSVRVTKLSKGQATRVRLLLSLAYEPELLLLDEPTTGLDASQKQVLMEELLSVMRDERRTIVISSHQIADLERICDRVIMLSEGRVIGDGTPGSLAGSRTLEERVAEVAS